jgi:hypothetical protein
MNFKQARWVKGAGSDRPKAHEVFAVILERLMSKLWVFIIVSTFLAICLVAYAIAWGLRAPN